MKKKTIDKRSTAYFVGIEVNENRVAPMVLNEMFQNVEHQPNNNPKFDFKVDNDILIDAKGSTVRKYDTQCYEFHTLFNTTANFFLCGGYTWTSDGKLELERLWMVPSEAVSDRDRLLIPVDTSQSSEWSGYELENGHKWRFDYDNSSQRI